MSKARELADLLDANGDVRVDALDNATMDASDILTSVKTVDGSGSGLDADLLDGQHASSFASASHSHSYLPLSGGTVSGTVNLTGNTPLTTNDNHYVNRLFTMIDNASPQWILLCVNGANNDVSGTIRMDRTSGNYQSSILEVIVSSGSSAMYGGALRSLQVLQSSEDYRLVSVTHNSVNYIAIKYTGNTYPHTTGAYFTGRLVSTGSSLTVVSSGITNEASFGGNSEQYFDVDTVVTSGDYYANNTSKVWHAGNDGSGSGLDADTVDGKHASSLGIPLGGIIAIRQGLTGAHPIPASGVVDSSGFMYCNGAAIPSGNAVSGSTPNLSDGRFLRGATSSGATGGSDSFTLAVTNLPAHSHTGTTSSSGTHNHTGTANSAGGHNHTFALPKGHSDSFSTAYDDANRTNDQGHTTSTSGAQNSMVSIHKWSECDMYLGQDFLLFQKQSASKEAGQSVEV
jgi:hypothetical protein